jgi:hypothetical protein
MDESIDLVCPRCGKTRSIIKRIWLEHGKPPMCQPCAAAIANKRRHHVATWFRLDEETVDEKLTSISKD